MMVVSATTKTPGLYQACLSETEPVIMVYCRSGTKVRGRACWFPGHRRITQNGDVRPHQPDVTYGLFSPALVACQDGSLHAVDAKRPMEPMSCARWAHEGYAINTVACDPITRTWMSGGGDGTLRAWQLRGTRLESTTKRPQAHEGGAVRALGFDEAACMWVSGGQDGALRSWRIVGGQITNMIETERAHSGSTVSALAYDPQSRIWMSGGGDGALKCWSVHGTSMSCTLKKYKAHNGCGIGTLEYDPIYSRWLSCGEDGSYAVWKLEGSDLINVLEDQASFHDCRIKLQYSSDCDAWTSTPGGWKSTSWRLDVA